MVDAGEGVSILPPLMLDPLHADVVVKPVNGEVPIQRVAAVRLPTRYLARAASEFLTALRARPDGALTGGPRRRPGGARGLGQSGQDRHPRLGLGARGAPRLVL